MPTSAFLDRFLGFTAVPAGAQGWAGGGATASDLRFFRLRNWRVAGSREFPRYYATRSAPRNPRFSWGFVLSRTLSGGLPGPEGPSSSHRSSHRVLTQTGALRGSPPCCHPPLTCGFRPAARWAGVHGGGRQATGPLHGWCRLGVPDRRRRATAQFLGPGCARGFGWPFRRSAGRSCRVFEPREVRGVDDPHVRGPIERNLDDVAGLRVEVLLEEVHRFPFRFGAAWLRALPAAVFEGFEVRPSRSTLEAARAADGLVRRCLGRSRGACPPS